MFVLSCCILEFLVDRIADELRLEHFQPVGVTAEFHDQVVIGNDPDSEYAPVSARVGAFLLLCPVQRQVPQVARFPHAGPEADGDRLLALLGKEYSVALVEKRVHVEAFREPESLPGLLERDDPVQSVHPPGIPV